MTTNTRESYTTPGKNNGHAGAEVFNHEGGQGKDGHTEVAGDQEASPPSPTPVPKPGAPYPSVTTVTSHVTITVDPPAGPGGAPGKGTLLNPAEFPTVTAKTRQEDNDRASPQTSESSVSIPAVVTAPPLKVTNAAETTSTGASPAPTANNPYPTATKTTSNITAGVEPLHAGGGGSADKQTIVQSSDGPLVTIYFQASDAWPSIGPMDPLSAKDGSGGKGTLANTADGAPVTVYFNGPDVWPSIGPIKWNIGSNSTPGTTFKIDDPALGKHKSPTKTTTTTKTTAKDGTVKTAHTHAAPVKDNLDEFVSTGSLTDTNTYKPLPPGTTTDTHTTAWMLEPTGKKTTTTKQATTTSSSSTTSTSPTAAGKETKNQPGTPAFAALPTIFDPDATYTTDT